MTTLRERLTEVFVKELKESHENSKEMIASNSTSFDEMGMANTAPGEFAQEEITDRKNLENTGSMANDTDFEGKLSCEDGSECPACDMADKIDDTMDSLASDIIDISVKDDEEDDEFFDDDDEEDEDEKRLMTLAHESVKGSLLNIFKKKLNEDRFGEEKFVVYLWPFAGYQMYPFEVEASHEEEALEKAVAKAEEEGNYSVFADDVEDAENHPDLYMYVDATPYGGGTHYVDAQNLRIEKKDWFGESVSKRLKESKGDDYAGPQDFVPDSRINASAVLNALKKEIGEGSEGIHVDQDQNDKDEKVWVVTQIDEEKLPKTIDVINVKLERDGNKYKVKEMKKDFPAMK